LAPNFKGPAEIIDINDTNAKVKIGNKIKVLNVNKLKLFLEEQSSETDTELQDLNFNDYHTDGPITRARARLINYKNAAHLALLMLKEEGVEDIDIFSDNIHSLCDGPCASCDSENDYFKQNPPQRNFTQKCQDCEKYKKLFLKLKEREDQCYQLKHQINFARHQQHHQIKSVETQSKTGIAESLREPLMKIAHKLLISDKSTFEQLTPSEQTLWTLFEMDDIYRFLTGEPDTVPEFQYNWTSIPRLQPLGPTISVPPAPTAPAPPAPAAQPPLPGLAPAPQPPADHSSSNSSSSSSPHSSPTPSTSGARPKTGQAAMPKSTQPDPSGASTSGTTHPADNLIFRNLRQRTKVDYKDLHTGASQFGREQFRKRCCRAGASVRKSVAKVRKMSLSELFPPISRNSSSSSTASTK
jgi:hypothetical protein